MDCVMITEFSDGGRARVRKSRIRRSWTSVKGVPGTKLYSGGRRCKKPGGGMTTVSTDTPPASSWVCHIRPISPPSGPGHPKKMCIRVDDGYDMGEWNVFARGSWTRGLDGMGVVRSGGESNRKATNDFVECSRNRFGRLMLIGGFRVPKTPGSCLFCNSNGMANRCGIYRSPNRGVDGEFVGCASPSSAITWNVHRHVVKF